MKEPIKNTDKPSIFLTISKPLSDNFTSLEAMGVLYQTDVSFMVSNVGIESACDILRATADLLEKGNFTVTKIEV